MKNRFLISDCWSMVEYVFSIEGICHHMEVHRLSQKLNQAPSVFRWFHWSASVAKDSCWYVQGRDWPRTVSPFSARETIILQAEPPPVLRWLSNTWAAKDHRFDRWNHHMFLSWCSLDLPWWAQHEQKTDALTCSLAASAASSDKRYQK